MNALVYADTRGMSREDWLSARNHGIGGSDIAAIMGLTPRYRTQIDVWLEKTGQAPIDTREPFSVNGIDYPSEAAYWGTVHEEAIADHFAAVTGYKVFRRNAILQHPDHPWMLANIDREVLVPKVGRRGLECKSASAFLADEWTDERVPLAYQAQCQWYMAITDTPAWYIASLIGGNKFTSTVIERDNDVIATLIEAGAAFWQHVTDRTMPPVDGTEKCADALANLYPQGNATEPDYELPPTFTSDEFAEYFRLRDEISALEERRGLLENRVKAELGTREKAWCGAHKIAWSTVISKRLNTKKLQAELPDIYAGYAEENTSRRFTIKAAK